MSKLLSNITLSIVGLCIAVLVFQNCSEVKFSPSDPNFESTCVLVEGDCYSGGTAEVVAGTQNLPPLKMFFVVDNSYTMYVNQLNLSQSFTKMFESSNSANLTPFDTTAYLINTSQYSYKLNESKLSSLSGDMIPFLFFEHLNYRDVLNEHRRTASISGAIPGDVYGYEIIHDPTIRRHDFNPAVVTGLSDNGGNGTSINLGMQKPRGQSADTLNSQFQERLSLLNPGISPFDYPEVLDRESGLCSMARILNKPDQFVEPGDFGIFTLVSDENDADPNGTRCISHIQEFTGEEERIRGTCEEYKVRFRTNRNVACYAKFKYGYGYNYSYIDPNFKQTDITYRTLEPETYSSPRTEISFTEATNQKYARTQVKYQRESCVYRDGVKTDDCTMIPQTRYEYGDHTANCLALARSFHSGAVNATCDLGHHAEIDGGCPSLSDPLCTYDLSPQTKIVLGNHLSNTRCNSKATALGAWSGASIECELADPVNNVVGSCPSDAYGCTSTVNYGTNTVTKNGNHTGDCYDTALDLPNAALDDDNMPICKLKTISKTFNKNNKTLLFNDNIDSAGVAALNSTCSASVLSKILADNPSWLPGGTCTIKSYRYNDEEYDIADAGLCTQTVASLCSDSDGRKRDCEATRNKKFNKSVYINENLDCNSACNLSETGYCSGPQTIRQHFETAFGADTCSTDEPEINSRNFNDELLSNIDNICVPSKSNTAVYLVQNGDPYFKDGVNQPKVSGDSSLKNYIKSEMNNLLGESQALSVFVRTAGDPTGNGGSRGTHYEALANEMGGSINSVLSSDYSPALVQLTEVITEKLGRTFTIVQMRDYHRVVKVLHLRKSDSTWVELSPNDWSSSWRTITIDADYSFELGDRFRFTFE